jgi:hypothetical protein
MREKVYEYLQRAAAPVPSDEIVRNVLGIQCVDGRMADRILRPMLEGDPRFVAAGMSWHCRTVASRAQEPAPGRIAALFIEGAARPRDRLVVRGAVCLDGSVHEFGCEREGRPSLPGVEEVRDLLEGRLLAVWNRNSLGLWNRLQREHGLTQWNGTTLVLAELARRLLPGMPERPGPEDLAARLSLNPPASDRPGALARILGEFAEALLDLVPCEHRSTSSGLRDWIGSEFPEADFTRFVFDREFLRNLPEQPGVYLMRDPAGGVIYVGKARNLRRRVGSYFSPRALREPKTAALHAALHSLEVRPAASEVDALLMEMRLIRDLRPRINRQTCVHESRGSYGQHDRLLLLVPNATLDRARIYFLNEGSFTHQTGVRLGRPPSQKLKRRIQTAFFGPRRSRETPREVWEIEIVFRWLARNRARLNVVDIDESGDAAGAIRILTDYLLDPDRLSRKVFYR